MVIDTPLIENRHCPIHPTDSLTYPKNR